MLADIESAALRDGEFRSLVPGRNLSIGLAEEVSRSLERYPTADPVFRRRLHEIAVENFPSWRAVGRRYIELGTGV